MPQERHLTLYLDDGDIVLSASTPGTDSTQLFRVHRVYLSYSSEVFQDMFAVATESTNDDEYDGVPLLHLPHDDARDLATLLDVIYHPSRLHELLTSCPKPDTPARLSGLARIARKYMVQNVAQTIVEHVTKDWPDYIGGWEVYQARRMGAITDDNINLWKTGQSHFPDEPVHAVLLALEHDAILPGALYRLLIAPLEAEWKSPESWHDWLWATRSLSARWSLLDRPKLMAVMRIRDEMYIQSKKMVQEMQQLMAPSPDYSSEGDCSDPKVCGKARKLFGIRLWQKVFGGGHGMIDFLGIYTAVNVLEGEDRICEECVPRITGTMDAQREIFWIELSELWERQLQDTR